MSFDLATLKETVTQHGKVARIVVVKATGSAPREVGASMLVWLGGQDGTIGGGALEWEATAGANSLLANGGAHVEHLALGPKLQQCCGGAVTLVTEIWDAQRLTALTVEAGIAARPLDESTDMPLAVQRHIRRARNEGRVSTPGLVDGWMIEPLTQAQRSLWVWGAGHVGRAIVGVLAPLPNFSVTWIDTAVDRFPDQVADSVDWLVASDLASLVPYAPDNAEHLILTYSHALDLAICHALLDRRFASAGLIGSATKWARFRKRLAELGHAPASILRVNCPIGDPSLGKHPQAIAISVAETLLRQPSATKSAKDSAG